MKKLVILQIVGLMLLTGAGCETLPEQPAANQTSDTTATEETQTTPQGQQGNVPAQNTNTQNRPSSAASTPVDEEEETSVIVEESNQERIQFFGYNPTHPRNYEAHQLFAPNSTRMSLAIIRASPAGTKFYEKSAWIPLDAEGSAMVKAGEDAAAAMMVAHEAFENKKTNAGTLSDKAYAAVQKYVQSIGTFEAKWGVSGLN